ncbi:hypothetical protein OU798_07855 [Prolixibacteraceae bacterium Z1-6]|uniref:Adhesin domain-containing protein n=1 Tax=Draconibacterium aestuarii TaxID=2998507 RepID=A0A9X3J5C1_9BACT|nr:hypothetical protein [Prolixibacteraceae bacterium Z1-6]
MKKQLLFKTLLLAIALLFANKAVLSQNYEAGKTLEKSAAVPENVDILISNHSGDIDFSTTNESSVKIHTDIKVTTKTKEEADKLMEAIENFKFNLNGNTLNIDTRFYKSMNTINGRSTITLLNGDKIKIKDFDISHKISIPKSASLNLKNKYSNVSMESLNGSVQLNLYSSKLTARNFASDVSIESKYSKLYVSDFNAITKLDLYDTDIVFKSANDLNIQSKYSKFEGNKAGSLTINSYDDDFKIDVFTDLKMEAKYSGLVSEAVLNMLDLDLYDSDIIIASAKQARFSGKYCELKLGNVKELNIPSSYDNDIYLGKTVRVQIDESKYSLYEMNATSNFSIIGYDDEVKIAKLNSDFESISVDGKYGKLSINPGSAPFKIDAQMKYGKVDFPESLKVSKRIEKNSELEIMAGENGGTVKIRGYDMKVTIK